MTDHTLNSFVGILLEELRALEDRRRTNTPGHSRNEVVGKIEADLREAGLEPWQLYKHILDNVVAQGIRRIAVNLLHDPARVPEYAAQGIAETIEAVMQEQGLDYNLGQQTVMAASILRSNYPPTAMLPIPKSRIDSYFIPFVEQVPAPMQGQSQSEATLNHTAHMLASIARFTAVHNHAYDDLLARKIDEFYEAQSAFMVKLREHGAFQSGGERSEDLKQKMFYTIVHPMEHLAELMDQATMTRDKSLVETLFRKKAVQNFELLDVDRSVLGLEAPNIERYLQQRVNFVALAHGMGYQFR